jgi:hypothetical protein
MEKIILVGIAMWFNFWMTDGFPPQKPVVKPYKPHVEFTEHKHPYFDPANHVMQTDKPVPNKIKCIVKDRDPH